MTDADSPTVPEPEVVVEKGQTRGTLVRVARYSAVKLVTLLLTVAAALYLTILAVNLGGYVDEIFKSSIREEIGVRLQGGWLKELPEEERNRIVNETIWAMEEAMGLHEPFLARTGRWLVRAMTLDLGLSRGTQTALHPELGAIQATVLQHLPYTLVLVCTANLLVFFTSLGAALSLSRKRGGLLDRANVVVQSVASAPSWVFGMILLVVVAGELRWLPFPRAFGTMPDEFTAEYILPFLRQMILPVTAIFLSMFFVSVYAWRSYFLIYRDEDYVEVAEAKGVPYRMLERQYILRPALPYVITTFAVMMIGAWQAAIALEYLFNWPGVGLLFLQSVKNFRTEMILGIVVVFAYLLAITVFLLDIVYALVDPRVRVGGGGLVRAAKKPASRRRFWARRQGRRRTGERRPTVRRQPAGGGWGTAGAEAAAVSPGPAGSAQPAARRGWSARKEAWSRRADRWGAALRDVARYPSAVVSVVLVLVLVGMSIQTLIALPYAKTVDMWRSQGGDWYRNTWYRNPKNARPAWVNAFRQEKLPGSVRLDSRDGSASKVEGEGKNGTRPVTISFLYDFQADVMPQDLVLYIESQYAEKRPFVTLVWHAADGRTLDLGTVAVSGEHNLTYLSQVQRLQRRYGERGVIPALFVDPEAESQQPVRGRYKLVLTGLLFEPEADLDAELVMHGQVFGVAGTDNVRRDLTVALRWGMPVALAFGLLGAFATSLLAMSIAAVGVWFGGAVDGLIQRFCELNMILPTLPIAMLVSIMYTKSIWAILGILILLSIFGTAVKNYRAAFLQMKDAPYIEAARAYGAGNLRIIGRYMVPRILPVMVPQIVIMVPTYVYYEATLAYLGVSDPNTPTWGKVIYDALTSGVFRENYYWALEPVALLAFTGLAFAGLGFALERILNPRLRST